MSKRPDDVAEQPVSLSVDISTQNSEDDARRKRREYRDSVSDDNAPLTTEDTLTKEQSTDGRRITELQYCESAGRFEAASQVESNTYAVRHTQTCGL